MKVKQIMVKKVISASPDTEIIKVAELLTINRIHGLPIISNNIVLGIITETDFFVKDLAQVYLPSYIDFLKKAEFTERISRKKKKEMNKLLNLTAQDIMTQPCFTIFADTDVKELVNIFKTKHYFTIPVVDTGGKMTGIITQADIINLIKV
ncbi:hypothetical protein COX67_01560 [Candidatus Falkowbacteria bacterium CG_4_10_14_0_2_um_filter_36_22]|uniref:CBS domain-containing protein n=1 Tax=Candidatus Falkowbacteria bacterium CG02_land_8_20_14_3_00_36_14 TaxID=1974560 RepID=A0A2M7DPA6_9BACT|nr:MAG: hypothetical protein COS18_02550 [Candidatus Falkowbacteria bacterium CG02_land_8_20_14_3_00_36_14]PIX11272.1 MAG: hypothetical protein COZ73_03080 [Candidatus Falkowbacteria bacterium CG_4_8_14_3_um_filter_36_11]PJA11104.1 MAG: hypothetical protein COX67_01560 [Candidatus Falkowbacteria bacterium CG_4_10_14_0_2_um_filter_36_22]